MPTIEGAESWAQGSEELAHRIAPRFARAEPRRRALAYLRGLPAPLGRKNGWRLAEAAGDAAPDGVQDFLSRVRRDADAVRDDLRAYVVERLGDPEAVLVLDETGSLKKGDKSAGVQRQYSGRAGRIENCRVGVFLGYAGRHGRALIDRALHLPERWIGDAARRAAAGIPDGATLTAKPKLGPAMLDRALEAGVPFAWVTGGSVHGADHRIRRRLEARGRGYALAATSGQRLGFVPVESWLAKVPPDGWRRSSAGDGAKGPRLYDWAYLPCRGAAPGWRMGRLLVRRGPAEPDELAFYLTHAPEGTTLARLVRVAGTRWAIGNRFEAAKGEAGLDGCEVRSWTGRHRHATPAMLVAHAHLAALRRAALGGGGGRARPRRRTAPPHRARGPPPALAPRLGPAARTRRRAPLVGVA
jgi:SRSO17 transposase